MDERYDTLVEEGWLDLSQAAEELGIKSPGYISLLIRNEKLSPAEKVTPPNGRRPKWLIHPDAILAYKNRTRAGKRRYVLTFDLPTTEIENAIDDLRQYLKENFDDSEYTFKRSNEPAANPRKKKSKVDF